MVPDPPRLTPDEEREVTPYEVVPDVPYWTGWYDEFPVYLMPDCELDPNWDEVIPVPDKLLELEVTDEVILSMLDEEVAYGVPVILESSGLDKLMVLVEIFSSNYLIKVFLVLN